MATTTCTSRLAIVVVAGALAVAASLAAAQEWEQGREYPGHDGGLVLPSPSPLPSLPPLPLFLRHLLLPSLPSLPRLRVGLWDQRPGAWSWRDQEYSGPRRYTRGEDREFYGPRRYTRGENREFSSPRRYTRGEDRRFTRPEVRCRQSRQGERRRHGEYGNRWR